MSKQLKKYTSLFFVLLFLFPTVTEAVHQYFHQEEKPCTETDVHFHQTEHECSICDFVPLIADLPPIQNFELLIFQSESVYNSFYKSPHIWDDYKCHYLLRGPPMNV